MPRETKFRPAAADRTAVSNLTADRTCRFTGPRGRGRCAGVSWLWRRRTEDGSVCAAGSVPSVERKLLRTDDADVAASLVEHAVPFPLLEQAAGRERAHIGERGELLVLDADFDARRRAHAVPHAETR